MIRKLAIAALGSALLATAPVHAAQLILNNTDAPGIGFNDPTPAAPVGGNVGTTLGEQRLIAYRRALELWGSVLRSDVPIIVRGSFARLNCTATGGTLASAGALSIFSDFPNAPRAGRWYGSAVANSIAGVDLDPEGDDIQANFNGAVGQADCIAGPGFYYGLDNNPPPGAIDFLNTFMHEVAHGLGFQNFANEATGALPAGQADIYMAFTRDLNIDLQWDQLNAQQIIASAISNGRVVWSGPNVTANARRVLGAYEGVRLTGTVNREIVFGTASFGAAPSAATLNGAIVPGIDGGGPSIDDGCEPFTNAAAVAGRVALVNRGTCGFAVKALNAQNAGARAVIIANNVAGAGAIGLGGTDPAATVATIGISLEDGAAIRAATPGVNVEYFTDQNRRAGAEEGFVRVFAPTVVALGSSISHFDTTAAPNLLMEPAITSTLRASETLDLTPSLMQDIGWQLENVTLGRCETQVPGALADGTLVLPAVQQCVAANVGRPLGYSACITQVGRGYEAAGLITTRQRISFGACGLSDALRSFSPRP